MGFEIYTQCFGETERTGIHRTAVRGLFPVIEEDSEHDCWRLRYDDKNSCDIGVTALASEPEMLTGLYVERPCADVRLWEALMMVLRMGSVVIFWPGGPPVVAENVNPSRLPKEMTDSMGPARLVRSADELVRLVRES